MHPFFKTKRGHVPKSNEPASEAALSDGAPASGENGGEDDSELPGDAQTIDLTTDHPDSDEAHSRSSHVSHSTSASLLQRSRSKTPQSQESHPNGTMHLQMRDPVGGDPPPIEQSEDRRKRRRKTPPRNLGGENNHPNWQQQLIRAGYSLGASESSRSTSPHGNGSITPLREQDTAVEERNDADQHKSEQVMAARRASECSPPKKMIKVRADGKLTSPKPREPAENKTKRGRKPASQSPKSETKVVIMKYSASIDDHSVGHSINDILSGSTRARPPLAPKQVQTKVAPKAAGPPKPMHPLFCSKAEKAKAAQEQKLAVRQSPKKAALGQSPSKRPNSRNGPSPPQKGRRRLSNGSVTGPDVPSLASGAKLRQAGSIRPSWPSKETVHIRGSSSPEYAGRMPRRPHALQPKKAKISAIQVPANEQVINNSLAVDVQRAKTEIIEDDNGMGARPLAQFYEPQRLTMTGQDLQKLVAHEINQGLAEANGQPAVHSRFIRRHPAINRLYRDLEHGLSSFDKFECGDLEWSQTYAPKTVADTLQPSHRITLLCNWLQGLTVNSTSCSSSCPKTLPPEKRQKKRKRGSGLDGFIVSGDEEDDDGGDGSDSEDVTQFHAVQSHLHARQMPIRKLRHSNLSNTKVVLVSGPHGCGKTAAIYAVARELGFDVFEINSGTRRSGRDILDRVGDMTKNHLVNRKATPEKEEEEEPNDAPINVEDEIQNGRQSTMKSFFQAAAPKKAPRSRPPKGSKKMKKDDAESPPPPLKSQKQSLILLEEVDVLFDEDKAFWPTVSDFIKKSRRPLIMTCTDETLIPHNDFESLSVLRLIPPPHDLTTDYLLLLAAAEGHWLERATVTNLYTSLRMDLRASIKTLDFWCQMAIGDPKRGLNWMLLRSNPAEAQDKEGNQVRLISERTFTESMGILGTAGGSSRCRGLDAATQVLSDVAQSWPFDVDDWLHAYDLDAVKELENDSIERRYCGLKDFELASDIFSVADLAGVDQLACKPTSLDPTLPAMTESIRASHTDGFPLLQADIREDSHGVYTDLALTLKLLAKSLLAHLLSHDYLAQDASHSQSSFFDIKTLAEAISARKPGLEYQQRNSTTAMENAFEPLSAVVDGPGHSKSAHTTALDGPISTIATDIAPYIRFIVSYDIRLEQQRLALSNMLSQGGRGGKKQRTTRASRAALEGGSKAQTRRERWFPKDLNFPAVRKTGGSGWQDALYSQSFGDMVGSSGGGGSRKSSLASIGSF